MGNEILIVAGFGRCGSTVMMNMLYSGGLKVIADNYASFEDMRTSDIKKDSKWLAEAQGKAIKILDLHRICLPGEFHYKIIWLKRNYKQQAKSIIKFSNLVTGLDLPARLVKVYEKDLIRDEKIAFNIINNRKINGIVINFEDLLKNPVDQAGNINNFVGLGLDIKKMASVVLKRTPECTPDMKIEIEMIKISDTRPSPSPQTAIKK